LKETEEHTTQLKADLENLAERMRKQIATLQTTHAHGLTNLKQNLADQFEGLIENSNIDLGQQEFMVTKRLRNHGTLVMNTMQQKLDHSLWESRGEEKQYNTALFKAFMSKANSIDTHFSALMQKLTEQFQAQFKSLEGQAQQAESRFYAETKGLLEKIGEHASSTESEIQEFYKKETGGHTARLDSALNDLAQDLSTVHDATTGQLTTRTRELSKSLLTSAGEVRDALTKKVTDLNDKVDTMMSQFHGKLGERTGTSLELKTALEEEKTQIFGGLKNELTDIRRGFEKRLTALMKEGLEKIQQAENEATTEIETSHKRCIGDLDQASAGVRQEIESEVSKFLQLIAEQKEKALHEISTAAGPGGADGAKKATKKTD
jgi:F0F1-type ATP synthase membrane subunit b/b'